MGQVVTIDLDIAKSVFQVHGVDAVGEVVVRRQIRRPQILQHGVPVAGADQRRAFGF